MKSLLAALLIFALAPNVSFAQEKPPPDSVDKATWHHFKSGVFFERKDWDKDRLMHRCD
jgi:hypothetical protein